MPVSLWRAIPLHRTIQSVLFPNLAPMVSLPGGMPAWQLTDQTRSLQLDGVMRRSYANQNFTLAVTWTVATGTVGTLILAAAFRRHILGTNAFSPYSAAQSVTTAAPTGYQPVTSSRTWTKAETQPLFPGGLGGVGAGDKFRLSMARSTGPAGAVYILGAELWVA